MPWALCAAALTIPSAKAAIVAQSLNVVVGPNASLDLSFDPLAAGATNLRLYASGAAPATLPIFLGFSAFPFASSANTGPLSYGTPITLTGNIAPGDNLVFGSANPAPPPDVDYGGTWANQSGPAYLGITFTASSQQYLGWVQLQLDGPNGTMTVLAYGYNDTPANQPGGDLFAGQSAVPEPSAVMMFAGGVVLLALRRRLPRRPY
jgi:hypothetical protein